MTRVVGTLAIAAVAAVLVGAGSGDGGSVAAPAATAKAGDEAGATATASGKRKTKVRLKRTQFGRVLFTSDGYALYVFTRDKRRKEKCYGDCAVAWPPLKAKGKLKAGKGVKQRLLGRVKRRDGGKQVTYKGQPLYGYINDPRGQVLCQDVFQFGGKWYVVKRSGRAVR